MKYLISIILIGIIYSSCSTNRTLSQVKLKEGTKLLSHIENDKLSNFRKNSIVLSKTKNGAIASIKLEENSMRILLNDPSKLIPLDTIHTGINLEIDLESNYRLGNKFAYSTTLSGMGLKLDSLDLIDDEISYLDNREKPLNTAYLVSEKLLYSYGKPVLQTLTIPFKFRKSVSDKPQSVSTGFNAGIAYGYQWTRTKINPIYNSIDKRMVGYDKKEVSFSAAPFIGLNSIKLNLDNTEQNVLVERNVLGASIGGVGVININDLNLGIALGFDFGLDDNSTNWDYQGKLWTGLVLGIDLIK